MDRERMIQTFEDLYMFRSKKLENQGEVEVKCIEFVNRIPLHMQQILANISRMLCDNWNMNNRKKKEDLKQLVNFFRDSERVKKIVSDTVTWKQVGMEEETIIVLQVEILKFVNLFCQIISKNADQSNDWTSKEQRWNSSFLCKNMEVIQCEDDERLFWNNIFGIMQTKKKYDLMSKEKFKDYVCSDMVGIDGGINRRFEQIKKLIPKMKKAIVSPDSIKELENLKVQYNPYAQKAEKLNNIVKKFSDEQKMAQKVTIEDMRKIVELLEKNLNGKLSTGDMVEVEKQLEHWKRELDSMTGIVKEILVEV